MTPDLHPNDMIQTFSPENVEQRVAELFRLVDRDLQSEKQKKRHDLLKGIAKYLTIQKKYNEGSLDDEFWHVFETFYKMSLYKKTVDLGHFRDLVRSGTQISIRDAMQIIINTDLPDERQKANLSFASKALHTVKNDRPIYDKKVKSFFNLPGRSGKDVHERIESAAVCYERLCEFYEKRSRNGLNRLLEEYTRLLGANMTPEDLVYKRKCKDNSSGRNIYRTFRFTRKDAMGISDVKKIDFMIWNYWEA